MDYALSLHLWWSKWYGFKFSDQLSAHEYENNWVNECPLWSGKPDKNLVGDRVAISKSHKEVYQHPSNFPKINISVVIIFCVMIRCSDLVGCHRFFRAKWRWRQHDPQKCWYPTTSQHRVIKQKTRTWILIDVKIPNFANVSPPVTPAFNSEQETRNISWPLKYNFSAQDPEGKMEKKLRRKRENKMRREILR